MNNRIMIQIDSLKHSQAIQDFINDSRDCTVAIIDTTSGFVRHKDRDCGEDKRLNETLIGDSWFERFGCNMDSYSVDEIISRVEDKILISYMLNYIASIKNIKVQSNISGYIDSIVKFLLKNTDIENNAVERYYTSDIIKYQDISHASYSIGNTLDGENFEHSKFITIDENDDIYRLQEKDALLVGDYIFIRLSSFIERKIIYLFKMIDINRSLDYIKVKTNISGIVNELQKCVLDIIQSVLTSLEPIIDSYFSETKFKFSIPQYAKYLNEKYHNGSEVFYDGILSCVVDLSLMEEYDIDNIFTFKINEKKSYSKEDGYIIDFPQLDCKLFSTVENNKNKLLLVEYLEKVETYCNTIHNIVNKKDISNIEPDIYKFAIVDEEGNTHINRNYMKGKLIYDTNKEKVGIIDDIIILRLEGKVVEIFFNVKNIIPKVDSEKDEELWRLNDIKGCTYETYTILNGSLCEVYEFINNYIAGFKILDGKIKEIGELRAKINKLQEEAKDIEKSLNLN